MGKKKIFSGVMLGVVALAILVVMAFTLAPTFEARVYADDILPVPTDLPEAVPTGIPPELPKAVPTGIPPELPEAVPTGIPPS